MMGKLWRFVEYSSVQVRIPFWVQRPEQYTNQVGSYTLKRSSRAELQVVGHFLSVDFLLIWLPKNQHSPAKGTFYDVAD